MTNRKSFSITKEINKAFSIVLAGFSIIQDWFANISVADIIISATISLKSVFDAFSMNIGDILLSSTVNLLNNLSTTISLSISYGISKMASLYELLSDFSFDVEISPIPNIYYSLDNIEYSIPLDISFSNMRLGVFNYLGDFVGRNPNSVYFDSDTLGDLDSDTLGDMDFTESV